MVNKLTGITELEERLAAETAAAENAYDQARNGYEAALRRFIIANITGEDGFKEAYQSSEERVLWFSTSDPDGCSYDELTILLWIIRDYEDYLEDLAEESSS